MIFEMGIPAIDIADVVAVRYTNGGQYKVSVLNLLIVLYLPVFTQLNGK
jgi:hypothetical protein